MPEIYVSSVIDAEAGNVWSTVRDFGAIADWVPALSQSRIEGARPADQIGCIRTLRLQDGGIVRERLLAMSDYDFSYTYSILESPMGVENYIATLSLTPITDGDRCFAEWSASFECAPDSSEELTTTIRDSVFAAALDSLKKRFGS